MNYIDIINAHGRTSTLIFKPKGLVVLGVLSHGDVLNIKDQKSIDLMRAYLDDCERELIKNKIKENNKKLKGGQ